jgi:hypothetical protein
MSKSIWAIVAGTAALGAASGAAADCTLGQLIAVPGVVSFDYDGFAPSDVSVPVLSTTAASSDCAGRRVSFELRSLDDRSLGFGEGLDLRSGTEILVASVSGENDITFRPDRGPRLDGVGAPPRDGLNVVLPRGQRVSPGVYQGQFRLVAKAFDQRGGEEARSESIVSVSARVQPSVGLSAAWGTELDLGTITTNGRAITPLKFRAYANTRYEIELTSTNDFDLIRPGRSVGQPIAYSPILSGQLLSEGAERGADFAAPPSASGFSDHTLDVVVPALALRPAGDYEDEITVTIRPSLS